MNKHPKFSWFLAVLFLGAATVWGQGLIEAETVAESAWRDVEKACLLPAAPAEWEKQRPSNEEIAKFRDRKMTAAALAADLARDFYVKYPRNAKAGESQKREYDLLYLLVRLGETNKVARLENLQKTRLEDPKLGESERFEILAQDLERKALSHRQDGKAVMLAEYEKGVRGLQKQFPKRPEINEMLLDLATQSEPAAAIKLAEELVAGEAAREVKDTAQGLLRKLRAVGRPLPIKFTATDGHEVDLAKLKGKVVLVDFWATWCPECVEKLPTVKALYEEYHSRNFEVIGMSLDEDRRVLEQYTGEKKMPWAQYFDGKGWDGKYCQEYQIEKLPAMWLVDKKGNLRDLDGGTDLREKVEKLLAEP